MRKATTGAAFLGPLTRHVWHKRSDTEATQVVSANLKAYAKFVTPGSYLLVQDTRLGPPLEAADAFLASEAGACFSRDRRPEYFMITQHWGGFLHRQADCRSRPRADYCQTDGIKCHATSKKCFRDAVCDGKPEGFVLPPAEDV